MQPKWNRPRREYLATIPRALRGEVIPYLEAVWTVIDARIRLEVALECLPETIPDNPYSLATPGRYVATRERMRQAVGQLRAIEDVVEHLPLTRLAEIAEQGVNHLVEVITFDLREHVLHTLEMQAGLSHKAQLGHKKGAKRGNKTKKLLARQLDKKIQVEFCTRNAAGWGEKRKAIYKAVGIACGVSTRRVEQAMARKNKTGATR